MSALSPDESSPRASPSSRYSLGTRLGQGATSIVYLSDDHLLRRPVAVKVLKPDRVGHGQSVARFLGEARITAQLQHPGIPPIHDLGRLPDGRPFLAMKVIQGQTLDVLLKARPDPAARLPWFLQVFEQIAQTIAYAHSKRVVNRDLKPANVMVGEFGEIQVLDWGLAKVLPGLAQAADGSPTAEDTTDHVVPRAQPLEETFEGSALGTPAYMPPEQARGEIDSIDERADVFALGGILCVILTGLPPYTGANTVTVIRRAQAADLSDAFARLDQCGADPEAVALCRRCLSVEPSARPADAKAVADAVASYRQSVGERVRVAELERTAAEARAIEQRKKRRVQVALLCALAVIFSGGLGIAWWRARESESALRTQTERDTEKARHLAEQQAATIRAAAQREFQERRIREQVPALLKLSADLRKAYKFREAGEAIEQARQQTDTGLTDDLRPTVKGAADDLAFVVVLDQVRMERSILLAVGNGKGRFKSEAAAPAYKAAFTTRGFDLDAGNPLELANRINASPIRAELIAGLDDWAAIEPNPVLRNRILGIARRVDSDPWLDRFRDPATWENIAALRRLARDAQPLALTPATLFTLSDLLTRKAVDPGPLLTTAHLLYPTDFLIAHALAQWRFLNGEYPAAIGHYRTARATRPDQLVTLSNLGYLLKLTGSLDEAEACYREALRLDPNRVTVHNNLGILLKERGDWAGAEACYRKVLLLDPKNSSAYHNLGGLYHDMGRIDDAIANYRESIRLNPSNSDSQNSLGCLLTLKGELVEAKAALRAAIALDPEDPNIHYNLGGVFMREGNIEGALKCLRTVLELQPNHPEATKMLLFTERIKARRDGGVNAAFGIIIRDAPSEPDA